MLRVNILNHAYQLVIFDFIGFFVFSRFLLVYNGVAGALRYNLWKKDVYWKNLVKVNVWV